MDLLESKNFKWQAICNELTDKQSGNPTAASPNTFQEI